MPPASEALLGPLGYLLVLGFAAVLVPVLGPDARARRANRRARRRST